MSRWYEFDDDKRKYVSVTTFLDVISKPFLYGWYAKMERAYFRELIESGTDWDELHKIACADSKEYPYGAKRITQESSDWGSIIHRAIDYTLKDLKLPEMTKEEQKVYDKWLEWWKGTGYELVGAEKKVRSRQYGYAGTLDAQVKQGLDNRIIDWKTGKNSYPEHKLQNFAYQHALGEDGEDITGGLLVYIPKDKDVYTEPVPPVNDQLFKPVLAALDLWRWANRQPVWEENV